MTSTRRCRELPAVPGSVREARAFVHRALADWGLQELDDTAVLLTSELATNAVKHARTRFAVVISRQGSGAEVQVLDDSPAPPQQRGPDLEAGSGRGLGLVAALAKDWGATPPWQLDGFVKGVRFRLQAPVRA